MTQQTPWYNTNEFQKGYYQADDDLDDRPLEFERSVDHPLSPAELRCRLTEDVRNYHSVELASDYAVKELFPDVGLAVWCRSANIGFTVNNDPEAEFRTYATLIFHNLQDDN
jgi:hypothetical protein